MHPAAEPARLHAAALAVDGTVARLVGAQRRRQRRRRRRGRRLEVGHDPVAVAGDAHEDARVADGAAVAVRDDAEDDVARGRRERRGGGLAEERPARVAEARVGARVGGAARAERVGRRDERGLERGRRRVANLLEARGAADDGQRRLHQLVRVLVVVVRALRDLRAAPAGHRRRRARGGVARPEPVERRQLDRARRRAHEVQQRHVVGEQARRRVLLVGVVRVHLDQVDGDDLGARVVGRQAEAQVVAVDHHRQVDRRRREGVDAVRGCEHPLLVDQRAAAHVAAVLRRADRVGLLERDEPRVVVRRGGRAADDARRGCRRHWESPSELRDRREGCIACSRSRTNTTPHAQPIRSTRSA